MKRKINLIITILYLAIALLFWKWLGFESGWPWMLTAAVLGIIHIFLPTKKETGRNTTQSLIESSEMPSFEENPTELVLLSEEGGHIASWNIYDRNGLVIGRDVGENHVTINLENTTYASMIDIEHAVLNYAGNNWYIEDISSKNGVSIQKRDGKKYKITYGKPCKLELGDIIFIGLTRLQIL